MGNNSKKCLKPKKKQKLPGSRSDSAVEDINMTNCCVTRPLIREERHYSAWTRAKIAASLCWGTVSGSSVMWGRIHEVRVRGMFPWNIFYNLSFAHFLGVTTEIDIRRIWDQRYCLWSPIMANVWQCLGSQAQKWEITEYLLLSSSDGCAGLGEDVTWPGDKSRYITHKLIRIQPWRAVDPEHAAVATISFICHTERH